MYLTVIAAGNVGKDPEVRFTPSGKMVVSFSVATNRQYKSKDGETVKETVWLRVTTWEKLAEVVNTYVSKGMKVLIEGTLTPDPATGSPKIYKKGDGTPGSSYDVTAHKVVFLSKSKKSEDQEDAGTPVSEDDFPF